MNNAREVTVRRSPRVRLLLSALLAFLFAGFSALGVWQVQRLSWKLDLIACVDSRVHAEPVAPPARSEWMRINAADHEYLRIRTTGTYDYAKDVLVQALTEQGPGFWVMTPFKLADGTSVLVNRGFVPGDKRTSADRKQSEIPGPISVTGLLRLSEPKGSFLRSNDPKAGLWYSRDVKAILKSQGIADGAPYFLDADATPNPGGLPVGGLTVIRFGNNHLVYAITWFVLALMVGGAGIYLWRPEKAARH